MPAGPATAPPQVIVAGATKAGTTWMHACLDEHPELFVASRGELDFFNAHYERGVDWYRGFFASAGERLSVDISPNYMTVAEVPGRIAASCPGVRLAFVLRNPVERAYSHYCMHLRGGRVSAELERELRPGSPYVEAGLYHEHLAGFLSFVPEQRMGIFFFEDLRTDSRRYLRGVLEWLGVEPSFEPAVLDRRLNRRKPVPRSRLAHRSAVALFRRAVKNERRWISRAAHRLRSRGALEWFHRLNAGVDVPELTEAVRLRLAAYYRDDVRRLSDLVGRDLSSWVA